MTDSYKLVIWKKNHIPDLSICIPTFNRPKKFLNLLNSIKSNLDKSIEVIVRDDSDDVKSLNSFKRLIPEQEFQFSYYKGKKIGLDLANLFLLEKARGNFIWWIADDDLVINDGVKNVRDFLKSDKNISFLWINFLQDTKNSLACNDKSRYFKNIEDVLLTTGHSIGLLSTYVLNRKKALKYINYGYKHVKGFAFASTAVVLSTIAHTKKSYLLKGPYLINKPSTIDELKSMMVVDGNEYQNNAFITYGVYFKDIIDDHKNKLTHFGYYRVMKKVFRPVWKGMYVAWIGGWDSPKGKKKLMIKLYWYLPELWIALFLFSIPKIINKKLYLLYKFLKQKIDL